MKAPCKTALAGLLLGLTAGNGVSAELANGIQAVVHDAIVTYLDVGRLNDQSMRELKRQYGRDPEGFRKKFAEIQSANLEQLLARQLILHDFKTAGYSLPESVIDDLVEEQIRGQFGDRMTATKTLEASGITYEKFRQQIRDRFVIEQMRVKNVSAEVIISPNKVKAYYEAHRDEFKVEDEVKLRMIVTGQSSDPNAPQAKALADEILTQIKEGATFEEMASIYSQRVQRTPGGEWFERAGLRKELAQAVVGLKAGEHTGVVETPDGCYLMRVEETRPAHYKPLSEVREQIENSFALEERSRLEKQWIERLKKKTFVRYFE
jgi:peptidyl-prolyl cis-trans isomerase SurA